METFYPIVSIRLTEDDNASVGKDNCKRNFDSSDEISKIVALIIATTL